MYNNLSNEQKLIILLGRLTFSSENVKEITELVENNTVNWFDFAKYALYHRTFTLSFYNLYKISKQYINKIPKYLNSLYSYSYNGIKTMNKLYEIELQEILSQANSRKITIIPVKGLYLIKNLYNDYGIRYSGDLDILIGRHNVNELEPVLADCGFIQAKYDYETNEYIKIPRSEKIKWKLNMSNILPYIKKSNSELDKFYKIDLRFALDDRLDTIPVNEMIDLYQKNGFLNPECYLMHLCTHFYGEAKYSGTILFGKDLNIIKLCDIREFIVANGGRKILSDAIKFAKKHSLEHALYYTIHILKQVYNDGYESNVLDEIEFDDLSILNTYGESTLTDIHKFKKGFWERFFSCNNSDELLSTPKMFEKI